MVLKQCSFPDFESYTTVQQMVIIRIKAGCIT